MRLILWFRLSATLFLGEKAYFRLLAREETTAGEQAPIVFYFGDEEVGRSRLSPDRAGSSRLTAEFLPEKVGRYRAAATFPDGTTQETRFIVFSENLEETEVATDRTYLKRLSESSGGRILTPKELARLRTELLAQQIDSAPQTRLTSLWDRAWFFYLIGLLLGLDWFLRRRWGLC